MSALVEQAEALQLSIKRQINNAPITVKAMAGDVLRLVEQQSEFLVKLAEEVENAKKAKT